jgi:hypothetical protein
VRTGKHVGEVQTTSWPAGYVMAPDGSAFVWVGAGGVVNVADVATGKIVCQLGKADPNCNFWISLIVVSPDGQFLAWAAGASSMQQGNDEMVGSPLRVFHLKTGKEVATWLLHSADGSGEQAQAMAFSPDGRLLAVAQDDDTLVHVWEVASGTERVRFTGHKDAVQSVAFSPDGRLLASGSRDGTALVWDLHSLNKADPTDRELTAAWGSLAGGLASGADDGMRTLVGAPERGVGLLGKELHPVAAVEPVRVARLIADLDSGDFTRRERASTELEALEGPVASALRAALERPPSEEVRRRLQVLERQVGTSETMPGGLGLRRIRAVEVLERIGSSSARKLLKELSEGAAEARTTREAKAALERLAAGSEAKAFTPPTADH